ncbi:hypothetical protein Hanom_Chr03g00225951 [Helianthus anomalus]
MAYTWRYLHSLIASSITTRGKSREWCMSGDLFFFYFLLYKRSCTLAHGLAQYFDCTHLRHECRKLYSGAYVCDSPFICLSPSHRPAVTTGDRAKKAGDELNMGVENY